MKAARLGIALVFLTIGACEEKAKPDPVQHRAAEPMASPATFVHLTGCAMGEISAGPALVLSDFGRIEHCWVQSDGGVTIELEALPGATVAIDGEKLLIGPDGKGSFRVALDPLILGAPVASAISDGAGVASRRLPVHASRPTQELDGVIEIQPARSSAARARALLEAAGRGKPLSVGVRDGAAEAAPPARTRASLAYVPPMPHHKAAHHGRLGRLDEVGLVAIGRDLEARDGGVCGPYSDGAVALPRRLLDVEVTVHDTSTGEIVATRTFDQDHAACEASGSEPLDARPPAKLIARWLDELVRKPPR